MADRRGLQLSDSNNSPSPRSLATAASLSSTASSARSVPAILSRKRKLDAEPDMSSCFQPLLPTSSGSNRSFIMEQDVILGADENEVIIISSDTECDDDESMASFENRPPTWSNKQSTSASAPQPLSSRIPLSTLQQANTSNNSLLLHQQHHPSDGGHLQRQQQQQQQRASLAASAATTPKFKLEDSKFKASGPPAAKKLKLRQSWSEFREYIRTSSAADRCSASHRGTGETPLPSLNWVDRHEMWELMCKKESGMYRRKSAPEVLSAHPALHAGMRAVLLDWLIEVCEVYRLHRETFYLAVDFIDRYLSKTKDVPKARLQLIGVTSLFIGSKIEEIYPPKLSEFSYVTDGACSDEQILSMELVILKELNWGLSPMTPNAWMKMFMQVANTDSRPHTDDASTFVTPQYSGLPFSRVMQLLDLCVLDMNSLSFNYSVLAATALALVQHDRAVATAVSGYSWSQLEKCAAWMVHFYATLRKECPVMVPRTFHNVQLENAHNIQTHSTDIRLLDLALDRLSREQGLREQEMARSRLSPDPSTMTEVPMVGMTPPDDSGDVRFYRHKMAVAGTTSSVFLSPTSPPNETAGSKKTLYSSLLKQ